MGTHTHYDEARDERWVCHDRPCVRHEVVPRELKRVTASPELLSLADDLARSCLAQPILWKRIRALAQAYWEARRA